MIDPATLHDLIATYGLVLLFLLVMAESAGLPLPGETALVTAAAYAGSTGRLSLFAVIATASAAAIIGDNLGFLVGHRYGRALVVRHGERFGITPARWRLARYLVGQYGFAAVFVGRFVALLRALAGLVAGTAEMHWPTFFVANALGAVVWASFFGLAAHAFGQALEHLTRAEIVAIVAALAAIAILMSRLVARRATTWQAEADRLYGSNAQADEER